MCADQFPLGMDLVGSDVTLVGCNAYFLIDIDESAEFLDIAIHCLVGVVRQDLFMLHKNPSQSSLRGIFRI